MNANIADRKLIALPLSEARRSFGTACATFTLALLIYATLSTPFPQNPGIIEAGIAALFAVFVTVPLGVIVMGGGFTLLSRHQAVPMWLHFMFFFFLWWNLINGAIVMQWSMRDIIRDIVPCMYLFLPVFFLPVMRPHLKQWAVALPWILSAVGVILSVRFYMITGISLSDLGKRYFQDNLLYMPYDPTVIFAGIFLPLAAFSTWRWRSPVRMAVSASAVIGGMLALGTLMAVAQRAPLGLAAACFVVFFLSHAYNSPKKLLVGMAAAALVGYFAAEQIIGSYELLMAKQEAFGANGKTDELYAVLSEISHQLHTLLVGVGWGGLFHDPAVNFVAVSYTHSVITYFLLKGGIVGCLILISYLAWILRNLIGGLSKRNLPVLLACIVALVIGLFFQVSYKAMTYGMVITLISLMYYGRVQEKKEVKIDVDRENTSIRAHPH